MIYQQLAKVQQALKAPKDQRNSFGNYNYRSCEGILEAVKPLLAANGLALTLTDEIVEVGGRIYVKATATVFPASAENSGECVYVDAYAREEESKKGMDSSQVTGAASSYARKYALNGLFCIDDNKDSDATNTHGKEDKQSTDKLFEDTANAMIQREGDHEYAICSKCGGYIYPAKKKDGSVISVKDLIIAGLRDHGQALCAKCYAHESKNR